MQKSSADGDVKPVLGAKREGRLRGGWWCCLRVDEYNVRFEVEVKDRWC